MAVIGIQIDKKNPTTYSASDFTFWMPQFSNFIATEQGTEYFKKLKAQANKKIFYSIYGSDWEYAMSLCIAHYLTLIAKQVQAPGGSTLSEIAGGGAMPGIITSASVGGFTKSVDPNLTMLSAGSNQEALFWNQTSYGVSLMALYKTKAVPSIFVVTDLPLPGTGDEDWPPTNN